MRRKAAGWSLIVLLVILAAVGCQSQKKKVTVAPRANLQIALKKFHKVLHPLQHKAVPEENAQAIRDSLDHLLALGDSVFIAPMPENWQDIADTLNALRKQFKANGQALKEAAKGQDDKAVLNAFEKYHDSFEAMMHTLIDNGKLKPYKEAEGQGEGLEKKE